jgi:hypothetical protein
MPSITDGVIIEYRSTDGEFPSDEFRKMFQEYFSFIIGSHIQKIGVSEYTIGYDLLSYKSQNPWKRNIKKNGNINPIPLKNGHDREFFESGFEMLVNSYLKENKLLKKYSKKEKCDYANLIKEDLESLSDKLVGYDFGTFVLNKLKNPYNYGIGEKMSVFFTKLSMEFDKDSLENKALKARNLMTHHGVDCDTEVEQRKIKKISDAYISLINRAILKLLDYNWYYVDYSKEGIKYLKMNQNL